MKKGTKTAIVGIALAVILFITLVGVFAAVGLPSPAGSAYAYEGGSGTTSDPYLIASDSDFSTFATAIKNGNTTICGKLTADITISGSWSNYSNTTLWSGLLDGDGHTLTLNNVTANYIIGYVAQDGLIKNLTIDGNINGLSALVGSLYGTIEKCVNRANVTANVNSYVGGLARESVDRGTILQCVNQGNVTNNNSGSQAAAGGFVGCVGNSSSGGGNGKIENSYNTGTVSCGSYTGGFVGWMANLPTKIIYCHNYGTFAGAGQKGAFVGRGLSGKVENSYYLNNIGNATATNTMMTLTSCNSLSADQFKVKENFEGFNFDEIWSILSDGDYPILRCFAPHTHEINYSVNANGDKITATCANTDELCPWTEPHYLLLSAPAQCAYDGTAKAATLSGDTTEEYDEEVFPDATISYQKNNGGNFETITADQVVNAGEYKATVTFTGDTAVAYVVFTITKINPTLHPEVSDATYGDTLNDVTINNDPGDTEGVWTWDDPTATVGNVGENEFSATFTPADTTNYETQQLHLTVTVEKADPVYVVPEEITALAGKRLSEVPLPAGWTWDDPDQNVGDVDQVVVYKATYTPEDTDNYSVIENVDVEIRVFTHVHVFSYQADGATLTAICSAENCYLENAQASLVLLAPESPLHYTGSAFVATLQAGYDTEAFPDAIISYSLGDTPVDDCINAGSYVATVTFGTATAQVTFVIAKADLDESDYTLPTELEAVYGESLSDVALSAGWAWKTPADKVGNAGTRQHQAIFTPEDTDNYNTVERTLSIEVGKATPTYDVPSGIEAPYGVTLEKVALPEYFSWMDATQDVGTFGNHTFLAKYAKDTENYLVVENIEVGVLVKWILVDPTQEDVTITIGNGEDQYDINISIKIEVKTEITAAEKTDKYKNLGKKHIGKNEDIGIVYDVKLIRTIGGVQEAIQPSDIKPGTYITVAMDIPEEMIGKSFRLLHVHSQNDVSEVTDYNVSTDGKTVYVVVDKLSEFVFVVALADGKADNGFFYGLDTIVIVGIVLGCFLGLCFLLFLLFIILFLLYKRDKDKEEDQKRIKDPFLRKMMKKADTLLSSSVADDSEKHEPAIEIPDEESDHTEE